jgi:osmotically-inducible protein OsmY
MTLNTAGKHGHSPADNKLTMAVCDALMRYTPIRIWGHNVDVAVHAGTVILSGVARSRAAPRGRLLRNLHAASEV